MKSFMFKEFLLKQVVAGKKTQTRRTHGLEKVNENPDNWRFEGIRQYQELGAKKTVLCAVFVNKDLHGVVCVKLKYQIGDICYLKENYAIAGTTTHHHIYQSDYNEQDRKQIKWKSKLMMPSTSARFKVIVTDIRVERLCKISEQDAIAEGVQVVDKYGFEIKYKDYFKNGSFFAATLSFKTLWQSINSEKSWNKNPWVFVYTFKLL